MEKIKSVSQYRVSAAFKPYAIELLAAPKHKASGEEKSGVVYCYPCKGCDEVYIGETKRVLGNRLKNIAPRRLPISLL